MKINLKKFKNPTLYFNLIITIILTILNYFNLSVEDVTTFPKLFNIIIETLKNPYLIGVILWNIYNTIYNPEDKNKIIKNPKR